MSAVSVHELGRDRQLIDLDFRGTEGLIGSYVLPESEGFSLIETGPGSCRDELLAGLDRAGIELGQIRHVFGTHIHLDHAGGMGTLVDAFPRATFYVHELGLPHMVDPTRLILSARRAWGPVFDQLWGTVAPVPTSRVVGLRGGESFAVRGGEIQVVATPGHARHHLAYFDTALRAIFTGDAAGVRLPGSSHLRPAVPPPDLDLEALFASLETMRAMDPTLVLYTHFGPSPDGVSDLARYRVAVEDWRDVALAAARQRPEVAWVERRLAEHDAESRQEPGVAERESLVSGYQLAAAGFLRYFETHGLLGKDAR